MKRNVSPRDAAAVVIGAQVVAAWREQTERLRALNDALAGRRPRPELRVIRGGKSS